MPAPQAPAIVMCFIIWRRYDGLSIIVFLTTSELSQQFLRLAYTILTMIEFHDYKNNYIIHYNYMIFSCSIDKLMPSLL
jgi:hypothetical protein